MGQSVWGLAVGATGRDRVPGVRVMKTLKDIQPGQTVGRYEFLVPIAQGGMAAVWAARQRGSRGFKKTVAVKTMLPSISDDVRFEQMFLDEARIASRIRHPNVVEILDLGEQDDVLYLVMEWVDGEPLGALRRAALEQGRFPLAHAVRIIAEVCAGLHAAHELCDEEGRSIGLVHRDISPQNVMVGYDGVVKVLDFGVAKSAGRTSETTSAGQVKGKPPYMSPEQALGKAVDRRTDLFALGIILYQLTTGRHPLRGENDIATLHNIVSERPILPPMVFDPDFPLELDRVIMKALSREPDERFQTAREFEIALDKVMQSGVGRVRTEELGEYVRELLGERGEERRQALREAVRVADERAMGASAIDDVPTTIGSRVSFTTERFDEGSSAVNAVQLPPSAHPTGSTQIAAVAVSPQGQWWKGFVAAVLLGSAFVGVFWYARRSVPVAAPVAAASAALGQRPPEAYPGTGLAPVATSGAGASPASGVPSIAQSAQVTPVRPWHGPGRGHPATSVTRPTPGPGSTPSRPQSSGWARPPIPNPGF